MRILIQREYKDKCIAQVLKKRFGFYKWDFYIPDFYEKPFEKRRMYNFLGRSKKM